MALAPHLVPTRVLHVVAPAPYGGAESVIGILTRAQRSAGYDVQVAAIVDPGDEDRHAFVTGLREDGCNVSALGVSARAYLRERREFGMLCEHFRPAIVHAHGPRVVVIDGPLARRVGARLVATVHGLTGGNLKNRVYERLMGAALRRYDSVVAVSTPIAEALRVWGVRADRLSVIPNAWEQTAPLLPRPESRRILGLSENVFTIGWLGRFVPEKGGDVIATALQYLSQPGWQAALIGDGPEWKATRAIVDAGGFATVVSMPGAVPAASRLLSAFDVLVLSSRTEGTPIALLEAMSAEVPVVATAVGGIPDVIGPNEGLLVPPDDPRALARAIDFVRTDRTAAAARAVAAKARVRDGFSVATWCESYSRVYQHGAP